MPELPPVTMAFCPLRTLLIGHAGITGSGNCSSMNFRSATCARPAGIIAEVDFSKSISLEFMLFWIQLLLPVISWFPALVARIRSSLQHRASMTAMGFRSPEPGASLDSHPFWKAFHDCAGKLPKNIGAAEFVRKL